MASVWVCRLWPSVLKAEAPCVVGGKNVNRTAIDATYHRFLWHHPLITQLNLALKFYCIFKLDIIPNFGTQVNSALRHINVTMDLAIGCKRLL